MKYKIEKNTVQETLIIPLYSRKLCSELYPNLYRDEMAVHLIDQIDYDFSQVEKKLMLPDAMEAPVEEGEKAGVLRYELKGKVLGEVEIVTEGAVKKAGYRDYLKKLRRAWMMEYSDNVFAGGK